MSSIIIACMLWGDWAENHGMNYIRNMYSMIARHCTISFEFVLYTDRIGVYEYSDMDIKVIPFPEHVLRWPRNLPKFFMHKTHPVLKGKRVLFFDLDTIIVDNIDDFFHYDGFFCGIDPFHPARSAIKNHIGGGVLSFVNGTTEFLWEDINRKTYYWLRNSQGGKERLILRRIEQSRGETWDRWQTTLPGQLVSFKRHCNKGRKPIPGDARIVAMHGKPKQHQIMDNPMIQNHWK